MIIVINENYFKIVYYFELIYYQAEINKNSLKKNYF